ncbi:hypothetical protein GJ496_002112 [Pomphorhynchus laevis]|nr:hypothetical protein GJ496_002112 [Pomphorhynchus laevis]
MGSISTLLDLRYAYLQIHADKTIGSAKDNDSHDSNSRIGSRVRAGTIHYIDVVIVDNKIVETERLIAVVGSNVFVRDKRYGLIYGTAGYGARPNLGAMGCFQYNKWTNLSVVTKDRPVRTGAFNAPLIKLRLAMLDDLIKYKLSIRISTVASASNIADGLTRFQSKWGKSKILFEQITMTVLYNDTMATLEAIKHVHDLHHMEVNITMFLCKHLFSNHKRSFNKDGITIEQRWNNDTCAIVSVISCVLWVKIWAPELSKQDAVEHCSATADTIRFMSHLFEKGTIRADTNKIDTIRQMKIQTDHRKLLSFLGLVDFGERFLPQLVLTKPLSTIVNATLCA